VTWPGGRGRAKCITGRIALEDLVEQGFDTLLTQGHGGEGSGGRASGRTTAGGECRRRPSTPAHSRQSAQGLHGPSDTSQHWRRNTEALDQDRFCQSVHVRRFHHYAHNAHFGGLQQ
jgi:hypothetical protein